MIHCCKHCGESPSCSTDPEHSTAYIISHECPVKNETFWVWGMWKELTISDWNRDND